MVVSSQAGLGQRFGLVLCEHAKSAACFHAERADAPHHFKNAVESAIFGDISPRCAHAEARSALIAGAAGGSQRFRDVHQILAIDPSVIVRRLRAVRAILGATPGFDAEQHASLHLVGTMVSAMDLRGAEHQIGERRGVDVFDFLDGPLVPEHDHFILTGYTSNVRTLAVIVLLLAVFGASTQCVADCLTPPAAPPCHHHSQGKSPEPCKHSQVVVCTQAIATQAAEVPAPAEIAFEVSLPETLPPGSARLSFTILRI